MSGKRMIHESLFSSEELSDIPIEARYLYIAMIIHADDFGRMRADAKYLKLKAFPFDAQRAADIEVWRDQLEKVKLISVYESGGKSYLYHPNWSKWQILRKDRMKPTDCPNPPQPSVNQMSTKCQPSAAEVSKEVNRSEVNRSKLTEGKEVRETSFASQVGEEEKARQEEAEFQKIKDLVAQGHVPLSR